MDDGTCGYCDHPFLAGQPILTETFLVVGEDEQSLAASPDHDFNDSTEQRPRRLKTVRQTTEMIATVAARGGNIIGAAGRAIPKGVSGKFTGLPTNLQRRMMRAGLGKTRGIRNAAEAAEFYTQSVPRSVRNLGEVSAFLKGKTASHIESVANAPSKAGLSSNIIWERAASNIKRGSDNIRRLELRWIKTRNLVDASGIVAKRMAGGAAKGAIWSAVLEAPVSVAENLVHVKKGRESGTEATRQVVADTTKAGAAGAAVGGAMVLVVAMGGGTILAPIALPLTAAGLGVYAISSTLRIRRAMSDEHEDVAETDAAWVDLAFHVECPECDSGELCHDAFLNSVVASAV
ncbi:MAG: hypothetical protein OXC55_04505 [Chloroflexi bacterium]|nr:hypothetical protein [Chloroflexota bacterium]